MAAAANLGRKPRPAALKLVNGRHAGVDSGGRKVIDPPAFVRLPPIAPDELGPVARAEWDRVLPELQRLGLTKSIDRASLTAYCLAWQRLVQGQEILDREGLLREGKQGLTRHPAFGIVESASRDLRSWAAEFGLTPSAENRISSPGVPDGDGNPFD